MLKNLKITTKLVAILVAPVLVLVALAFVGVSGRQAEANEAQRVLALTDFVGSATTLLKEVEKEAFLAARFSGSQGDNAEIANAYEQQQQATDAASEELKRQIAEIDPAAEHVAVKAAVGSLTTRIGAIPDHRATVTQRSTEGTRANDQYEHATGAITDAIREIANSLDDPILFQRMSSVAAVAALGAARANTANLVAIPIEVGYYPAQLPKNGLGPSDVLPNLPGNGCRGDTQKAGGDCPIYQEVVAAKEAFVKADEEFVRVASPNDRPSQRAQSDDSPLNDIIESALGAAAQKNDLKPASLGVTRDEFAETANKAIEGFHTTTRHILLAPENFESVATIARAQASQAQQEALRYLLGAVLAIAVAAVVTYAVGRSITVPLRRLTGAAYVLSTERLPGLVERLRNPEEESHESLAATLTPIDIQQRDEIGQLADSFNAIQQVTIEVAEEQSVLLRKGIGDIFINLARRNQTLLDRQIEFIDQLEANEEDPDQLDNLFKLDHLATRMRRNAESLLVLAGAEPPRRRGRPVALADVVRVAIGEVEDFARIQLLALDEATVGGNVAVDLAHLLSELMENATHFSPPDTMVEIVGHRSTNGYILSVSDQGIGMSPEQLAEANHQLARPPLVGLALSRSLGFIVIGRLAQRFEVSVKLTASPSGGVTALVTLPAELVAYEGEDQPPVHTPAPPVGPSYEPMAQNANDVVVIDRDLSLVDQRYDQGYDYEPQAPTYDEPSPAYEQPYDQPVGYQAPYEPQAPAYDEAPTGYAPQPSGYEQPYTQPYEQPGTEYAPPSYQPQPGYEPVARADEQDAEFERGLQEILGDEHSGHAIAGTITPTYDEPTGYAQPAYEPPAPQPAAPVRPAPIQTVAEQIAAASRAEASQAELTAAGLVRRTPKKRSEDAHGGGLPITQTPRATTSGQRSPEEVRKMLSRYRSGLNKGRNSADPEKADS